MNDTRQSSDLPAILPNPDGGFCPYPIVMTEDKLTRFLRIPEISNAANHHRVTENLKRNHGLPRIRLCGRTVYLADSVKQWLQRHVACGN